MAKIEIYGRVRPTDRQFSGISTTKDPDSGHELIHIQKGETERVSTPSRYNKSHSSSHSFQFKRVFGHHATQEEVFNTVAEKIINSFLEGYNGTIFAYGQTSSGKTHTIEGSGRKFADRGIIPRSLSHIYREVESRTEKGEDVSIHISYMEIYQDTGYDLLNPGMRPGALMVTLPKIHISEGPGGQVTVRNLSSHLAATEEVAQSLLFQGSTCRKVAETSMNQCSSRSHSIFTITLTAKSADSEVITKSKLNLVDLAGSERVAKTGADGRILQEAKHINLSLHHLEHVIVTLQHHLKSSSSNTTISPSASRSGTTVSARRSRESSTRQQSPQTPKSRSGQAPSSTSLRPGTRGNHVPYRNCMLTMVLKDSLGGNCLTAMIATISVEEENLGETISTLRFSQRVGCISNRARKNEELDDKAVIKKLKHKITELEHQVSLLKEQAVQQVDQAHELSSTSQALTDQEKILCHQILHGFFHGKIDNPVAAGINTAAKFHECLQVLKMVVLQALGINRHPAPSNADQDQVTADAKDLASQVKQTLQPSTTTPSPNSRLSSGFGSLVDDDGITTYESSHTRDTFGQHTLSPVHQQATKLSSPPVKSARDQLSEQRIQKKLTTAQNQAKHSTHISPTKLDRINPRSEQHQLNTQDKSAPGPIPNEKSPRHVGRAWMSPAMSLTSSTDQTHSSVSGRQGNLISSHSPNAQISNQVASLAKPLSPREEKELQKLAVKKEELRKSKTEQKKLESQVLLLDLHVEEEKLKSELDQIGEQLAKQHALVTMLQKSQSSWEELCAEKIAEQQLRIRQAKTHQRLMDLQYHIQSSHHRDTISVASASAKSEVFTQAPVPVNVWSAPPVKTPQQYHISPTTKVQRELEKHELKQTQVHDQIEKLRMSQIEKQLELKEASTRRKILALKQQLLANQSTTHNRAQTGLTSGPPSEPRQPCSAPPPAMYKPVETKNDATFVDSSSRLSNHRINGSTVASYNKPSLLPQSPSSLQSQSQTTNTTTRSHQFRNVETHVTAQPAQCAPKYSPSKTNSPIGPVIMQQTSQNPSKIESSGRVLITPDKPSSEKSSAIKSIPVKLTLPEEIKETEYMTALQKQKARVSRIRRCIVAATVIQRAWRSYRKK